MRCFFQKYQESDKCATSTAFIVNIRQCALFFKHTELHFLMLVIGYLGLGPDNTDVSSDPELSRYRKGRPSGPFKASKLSNYVVPKSSRVKQHYIPEGLILRPHRCGNLHTMDTKLHHKLSQIVLSSDTKQNLQLIELLLILKTTN
jgi:hypothetical protein